MSTEAVGAATAGSSSTGASARPELAGADGAARVDADEAEELVGGRCVATAATVAAGTDDGATCAADATTGNGNPTVGKGVRVRTATAVGVAPPISRMSVNGVDRGVDWAGFGSASATLRVLIKRTVTVMTTQAVVAIPPATSQPRETFVVPVPIVPPPARNMG
jgi:hypothetical protein